jgi:hypothetical protein
MPPASPKPITAMRGRFDFKLGSPGTAEFLFLCYQLSQIADLRPILRDGPGRPRAGGLVGVTHKRAAWRRGAASSG